MFQILTIGHILVKHNNLGLSKANLCSFYDELDTVHLELISKKTFGEETMPKKNLFLIFLFILPVSLRSMDHSLDDMDRYSDRVTVGDSLDFGAVSSPIKLDSSLEMFSDLERPKFPHAREISGDKVVAKALGKTFRLHKRHQTLLTDALQSGKLSTEDLGLDEFEKESLDDHVVIPKRGTGLVSGITETVNERLSGLDAKKQLQLATKLLELLSEQDAEIMQKQEETIEEGKKVIEEQAEAIKEQKGTIEGDRCLARAKVIITAVAGGVATVVISTIAGLAAYFSK